MSESRRKYYIVHEYDGDTDIVLAENLILFEAECLLCRFLNQGYHAYMMESDECIGAVTFKACYE